MEIGHIIPHIEALVFASDRPLTAMDITELINNAFGFMEDKISMEQISTALEGIIEKYQSEFYPFELRESGGGWQFLTKKDYHKTIAQLNGEKYLKRLSNAALETLAIIAYKQPVTKADMEAIRGVSCDYSIQKLLEKELVVITGRDENLPGKPLIYATSKTFMDYFGLNSVEDLPKLKEIFDQSVDPTPSDTANISFDNDNGQSAEDEQIDGESNIEPVEEASVSAETQAGEELSLTQPEDIGLTESEELQDEESEPQELGSEELDSNVTDVQESEGEESRVDETEEDPENIEPGSVDLDAETTEDELVDGGLTEENSEDNSQDDTTDEEHYTGDTNGEEINKAEG